MVSALSTTPQFNKFIKRKGQTKEEIDRTVEIFYDFVKGKNPYLLVDTSNVFARSFHARKEQLFNHKGIDTGGLFFTTNTILTYLHSLKPKLTVCTFDIGTSERHRNIYKEYKKSRERMRKARAVLIGETANNIEKATFLYQRKECIKFIEACGIYTFYLSNIEADSILGYAVDLIRRFDKKTPIVIISNDKDFIQLFYYDNVFIFDPLKNVFYDKKTSIVDRLKFDEKVLSEQISIFRSLIGDSSDNIPGINGVGNKTCMKLFNEIYDSGVTISKVDDIVNYLENKGDKDLRKFEKEILENVELININMELMDLINIEKYLSSNALNQIKDILRSKPTVDVSELRSFFNRNDFDSLILQFPLVMSILKGCNNNYFNIK